jgi:alginate O-acetyltransferase complex protein AlgI
MTINTLGFVAFVAIAAASFHLAPGRWRYRVVLPLVSAAFLAFTASSFWGLITTFGFVATIVAATGIIVRYPRKGVMALIVVGILLIFGWLKGYALFAWLPLATQMPATIGMAYMLIRGLQLIADAREDKQLRPGLLDTFSFLTAWPCLVSGPVQRYQEFAAQAVGMASYRLNEQVFLEALGRMARGWFCVLVLGDIAKHFWLGLKAVAYEGVYPLAFGGSQLAFLAYVYLDFSGYTDIVIGAGRLVGLKLPENFNRPFEARSFLEFWGRWHMTMSNWFKTYVYNPVLRLLATRWPAPTAANVLASIAFFVTFFLVGMWHGTTGEFAVVGLLLGLGASVNQLYRGAIRRLLGKQASARLSAHVLYGMAAKGLTFAYLCVAIIPLGMQEDEMRAAVGRYGITGLTISQLFVFLVMAPTALVHLPALQAPRSMAGKCFIIALAIVAIEMYVFLFSSADGRFFYQQY